MHKRGTYVLCYQIMHHYFEQLTKSVLQVLKLHLNFSLQLFPIPKAGQGVGMGCGSSKEMNSKNLFLEDTANCGHRFQTAPNSSLSSCLLIYDVSAITHQVYAYHQPQGAHQDLRRKGSLRDIKKKK